MLEPQKRIFSSGTEDNVSGLGGWVINVDVDHVNRQENQGKNCKRQKRQR